MSVYINQKQFGTIETVDEFDNPKEAREALREYQMAFHGGSMYLSSRATRDWRTSGPDSCIEELMLS